MCLVSGETTDAKNKEVWRLVKERRANINSLDELDTQAGTDDRVRESCSYRLH